MNVQGVLLEQPEHVERRATATTKTTRRRRDTQDLTRALSCLVCAADGIVNHPPKAASPQRRTTPPATPTTRASAAPVPAGGPHGTPAQASRAVVLTDGQARILRRVWSYLAAAGPGGDPDSRLLALICVLRAARSGHLNLVAQDVHSLRATDPHAAIASLTSTGWLDTTPETVLAADPTTPAACSLPEFLDPPNPWAVGKTARARASGWTTRVLTNKLLRKKPTTARIAALYLTVHASPDGAVEFLPEHLVIACALGGRSELVTAIKTLLGAGWLAEGRPSGTGTLRCQLTEAALPLAPAPAPPQPNPNTPSARSTQPVKRAGEHDLSVAEQAKQMVLGREVQLVRWVDQFRALHGHGPSWAAMSLAQGWPREYGRPRAVSGAALLLLHTSGWLDGRHTPYGMRPGWRYRALHNPHKQPAPQT